MSLRLDSLPDEDIPAQMAKDKKCKSLKENLEVLQVQSDQVSEDISLTSSEEAELMKAQSVDDSMSKKIPQDNSSLSWENREGVEITLTAQPEDTVVGEERLDITENEDHVGDDEMDTRSEVSSSSRVSNQHSPPLSSESSSSHSGSEKEDGDEEGRGHKRKRKQLKSSIDEKSSSPKRPKSDGEGKSKKYDYSTKLNYLFRDARFFLMKSNNPENISLAKSKGVWSTPPQNEAKLNQAFRQCRNVLLVFSVKESGKFCGFARLSIESRRDASPVQWILPPGLSSRALGGVFRIDWISKKDLSFTRVMHLYNPWNEGKPVKIGRDGQEVENHVGEELCRLFAEDSDVEWSTVLRRSKDSARRVQVANGGVRPRGPMAPLQLQQQQQQQQQQHQQQQQQGGGRRGFRDRNRNRGGFGSGRSGINDSHDMGRGNLRRRQSNDDDYHRNNNRNLQKRGRGYRDFKDNRRERSPGVNPYAMHRERAYTAAYAEFMREYSSLGPIPYPPPPPFEPLAPARYYDGPPLPEYPPPPPPPLPSRSSRGESHRSYERSVDEFLRRTADRREDRSRERRLRERR
ncbi:YTH domain-containing protein 1-like [Daphnia pulicaria]|uniref:YTH domain-containing protein 1-like n=1 Tax=Daphnia pulicaria TaxID=35523 RepID=UPI001EECEEF7|nr:YTH domain-containing protein 1-like [Daphnia pulicaria]